MRFGDPLGVSRSDRSSSRSLARSRRWPDDAAEAAPIAPQCEDPAPLRAGRPSKPGALDLDQRLLGRAAHAPTPGDGRASCSSSAVPPHPVIVRTLRDRVPRPGPGASNVSPDAHDEICSRTPAARRDQLPTPSRDLIGRRCSPKAISGGSPGRRASGADVSWSTRSTTSTKTSSAFARPSVTASPTSRWSTTGWARSAPNATALTDDPARGASTPSPSG